MGRAARAPAPADEAAALTAAPATSDTVPSAAPARGAVGARESSAGAASSAAAAETAHSTGDTTAPVASGARAARKSSGQKLDTLAKFAARGGRPPTPLIPVQCLHWRSATVTAASTAVTAEATLAAAAATTPPAITTHGGKQPMLEHCCDPLILGKDANGMRGKG